MNLVDRAKNILLTPKNEWPVIELESTSARELYLGYVVILAAIGPIALMLSQMMFGVFGFFFFLITGIVSYLFVLLGVYLFGLLANFLAPKFGGISNNSQALKLVVYSATAVWIASIGNLLPFVGGLLGLIGLVYTIYLLYLGTPTLMKVPADKTVPYVATLIIICIVIGVIVASVIGSIAFMGRSAMFASSYPSSSRSAQVAAASQAATIAAATAMIEANAQRAQSQTTTTAPGTTTVTTTTAPANPGAALAAMAAAGQGGQTTDPVDKDILKALLPDTVGSLPRTGTEATKGGMATMQISEADGDYGDSQKHAKIKVIDMGGAQMFGIAAAWAMVDLDKSSDTGYEKVGKVNGRPTHEKFDKNGGSGEYAVVVANRFMIEAEGNVDMSALKDAVAAVDPAKLEALKDVGVHKTN